MEFGFITLLVIGGLLGSAIMIFAIRKGAQKQADYEAFATMQGWTCEENSVGGDASNIVSFRDPSDDWTLSIHFVSTGGTDGSTRRRVEWKTPQGVLAEGEAVLGMPLPEKTAMMLQNGGMIGDQILTSALKATLHAIGRTKFNLEIDKDNAGDPGGVVMASDGVAHAMDAFKRNADLAQFRKAYKAAEIPVIIRDENGLTLRRPGAVGNLEDLKAFVALGKSLRSDL